MALIPHLEIRQTQSLTMTPQLRQAIRLLQMTAQELDNFIDVEIQQNPFLQKEEEDFLNETDDDEKKLTDDFSELVGRDEIPPVCDVFDEEIAPENTSEDSEDSFYEQAETSFPDDVLEKDFTADAWRGLSGGADDDGFRAVDICPDTQKSLVGFLLRQARMTFSDEKSLNTAILFIESLDENGFLPFDLSEIRKKSPLDEETFFSILKKMKMFEPTGVFSQSLPEFFACQLREKNRFDPAMEKLLTRLDLVADKKYNELAKICGVDLSDIADMMDEIRRLNPRCVTDFDEEPVSVVIPDVFVRQDSFKTYHVVLNSSALPKVLINRQYASEIRLLSENDKSVKKFYTEKMGAASFLVKALNQRAETILKVATFIVEKQKAFFDKGPEALKPMILKDVALATGMHESTISRVTNNKYLACSRGVFELKYFFSKALEIKGASEGKSSLAVKERISALIKAETAQTVLSDEDLVVLLRREGIEIARRTVAKYRESLSIATSAKRKREKRLKI